MTATNLITDTKFAALKDKLRELFELDKSDLDFGIYRIMAAKNKEVTEFLDRQLKDVVRETLAAHGAGAAAQIQAEIEKARSAAQAAGFNPDESPKVKELTAKLASAGGASAAELEADIYNHLLAFFSRYYDEGDFISKRRYKGDTYAIPYSGEEVTLHWANKDQYYIKSGEWHKDYRFKAPDTPGSADKTVRFRLVEATQEVGNNKEADEAKRRYILAPENPVEESPNALTLRFEFRVPTQADKDRAASGAVAVFGGDYAKPSGGKKGDEREQFCADAERRALSAMPEAWKRLIATPGAAATADKPARTLLGKHLDHFSARNTFDYFIHKDLGGFLRRELDFYIKNEVVRLDDLGSLPTDHLQRVQGKVKAIRSVAGRIISFLASVEDFQKKLWLKKKLVLNTHWLVTVDRLNAAARDTVASSSKQWAQWESLGFKPDADDALLVSDPAWGSRAYLDANDKLVVDTSLFPESQYPGFTAALLASDQVLSGKPTLDDATTGVLIHSENFQALNLMQERYRGQLQCVYIDPPYNTDAGPIIYKNGYKSSSWLTLMQDRICLSQFMLSDEACYALAIDDFEMPRLSEICDASFGNFDRQMIVVNHHPQGGMSNNVSRTHEYMLIMTPLGEDMLRGKAKSGDIEYRSFALSGPGENKSRAGRPNSFYAVLVDDNTKTVVGAEKPPRLGETYSTERTKEGYTRRYPIAPDGSEKVWCRAFESAIEAIAQQKVVVSDSGTLKLAVDTKGKRSSLMSNWTDSRYNAGPHGTALIADILGLRDLFSYPKSLYTVVDAVESMTWMIESPVVLDFFGGSGTTGHAVLDLNRDDGAARKFILVEMGAYFYTVVKPRIAKVIYSPDWKEGNAQSHGKGMSALVKCFALESYEDALNNLPAPSGTLLDAHSDAEKDALITYGLDLELGPHLLNLDAFRDPWGCTINAQLAGDAEIKRHRVDLVETFNYLIGLKVHTYGPLERYSAEFERAAHAEGLGRLNIKGRLRRDKDGAFVFQRVEGVLNDADGTRVLVIWRKLSGDAERDAAVLQAWMDRHQEDTKQRSEHRDYHLTYVNGPVTLPQIDQGKRNVLPIEQTFKDRMFEDTDSGGGA